MAKRGARGAAPRGLSQREARGVWGLLSSKEQASKKSQAHEERIVYSVVCTLWQNKPSV